MSIIDLRSDTVTKPTPAMRKAMAEAIVGDDVFGEDPTVNRLESMAAKMLGTEAAIFATSGTQSNLLGVLSHCQRGDEYIAGQQAHTYKYEGGGAAVFGSIQPQPLEFENDGTLDLEKVEKAIKPDDFHFARTKLLCLESTQSGKPLPLDYLEKAADFAKQKQLKLHLDGARIFNAAAGLNAPVTDISRFFDSISFCLSKGLGAPVGSLLCSTKKIIKQARRWRKVLGGGMRQAGILAAAGIEALTNNVERLAKDHENAEFLGKNLAQIEEVEIVGALSHTNMVFVSIPEVYSTSLSDFLKENGILITKGQNIRLVTHMDVTEDDIKTVIKAVKQFFS